MKHFLLVITALLCTLNVLATHNRGGNITYEHLGGNTYRVIVMTCTYSNAPADRPELYDFDWGDGTIDTLDRDSIVPYIHPSNSLYDSQKNYYTGIHTYAGPGVYTMCVVDPNRNAQIENILNSVQVEFALQTELVISPFAGGYNNSVVLDECPCPELACVNHIYCYNLGAYDPDGDSLAYELVPPMGSICQPLNVGTQYVYPDAPMGTQPQGGGGTMTIDPITGTLCWDSPQIIGMFNFTIKIKEYRNGYFMGFVIRDIQLFVLNDNCNNDEPEIEPLNDTCVIAGDNLSIPVIFSDDVGATLTAFGEPFSASPPAFMMNPTGGNPDTSYFIWNTACSNVQASAYPAYFVATDGGDPVALQDIETMSVTVNGPPVTGLTVTPSGNGMNLSWDPNPCTNIIGYKIYRRSGQSSYTEDCCSQNAPEQMGYTLVGQTNSHGDTSYYDNSGLVIGNEYCYIITACYNAQLESCVSDQVCNQLQMDVPVITHVSIVGTSTSTGADQVCWAMPKELDTLVQYNNHEFMYRLYRSPGNSFSGASQLVHSTATSMSLALTDTCHLDQPLNTVNGPYTYQVELIIIGESTPGVYDDTVFNQFTNEASSVFLTTTPADNKITLSWEEVVPWGNYLYEVYKETAPGLFTMIATTTQSTYVDSGLVNGSEYCYKIRSIGEYSSPGIIMPIYNWSQEVCDSPIDLEAPCPPVLSVDDDCDAIQNSLWWNNPNNSCADDVMSYNLYYSVTDTGTFSIIQTFNGEVDTTYLHVQDSTIAGCYYVTAVDSVQYSNESEPSNIICVDNCPYYWVPNIFTPNNDGDNDRWISYPYRYIKDVDVKVFNRWGQLVFQTSDPDIKWDGTVADSEEPASEGTYFYIIQVNTIRLTGIVPEIIKGHVTLMRGSNFSGN